MCPSELCSILHELLVGQTSEGVRELGVGFGDGIVNIGGRVGTFFVRVAKGPNWTFLDIRTFGRHSGGPDGEELQLQDFEGGGFSPMALYTRELARDWTGTEEIVELNRAVSSRFGI